MKLCEVSNCGKLHEAKGFCVMHYARYRTTGSPHIVLYDNSATDDRSVLLPRFKEKFIINKRTGCWPWIGSTSKPFKQCAYTTGEFAINGKKLSAPHASYLLYSGVIKKGKQVLHKCNNPLCVNPDHLYLGTHQDNMKDMAMSQRSYHLKLDKEQVIEIFNSKERTSILMRKYGIAESTVQQIRSGRNRTAITEGLNV